MFTERERDLCFYNFVDLCVEKAFCKLFITSLRVGEIQGI